MKNILVVFPLLLSACTVTKMDSHVYLHSIYIAYLKSLETENHKTSIDFLSTRNRNDLLENSKLEEFSDYFPFLSSINTTIAKEIDHYQKIESPKACLTINGFDSGNEPTSINIEFLNEESGWKLDYIQIKYHSSKNDLPKNAVCPVRY